MVSCPPPTWFARKSISIRRDQSLAARCSIGVRSPARDGAGRVVAGDRDRGSPARDLAPIGIPAPGRRGAARNEGRGSRARRLAWTRESGVGTRAPGGGCPILDSGRRHPAWRTSWRFVRKACYLSVRAEGAESSTDRRRARSKLRNANGRTIARSHQFRRGRILPPPQDGRSPSIHESSNAPPTRRRHSRPAGSQQAATRDEPAYQWHDPPLGPAAAPDFRALQLLVLLGAAPAEFRAAIATTHRRPNQWRARRLVAVSGRPIVQDVGLLRNPPSLASGCVCAVPGNSLPARPS